MALALYRRYRPDTFEGVIGQDHVTKPLSRALDEGKLTHAYLFSGPRGCGKTSSARILARCINCVEGPTSHPCGKCESCRDLSTQGSGSIDVVEIDAASHGSVEDARELRERAGFAPARDRYKIFILDEAHMVTSNGFNALLKIVEEPPEHVMFIFATTEPDKVISTIRSRTHHYPFRLVPPEIMQPYLEDICQKEDITLESGVLKLAMRAGAGSMRDTLSVLDQLMVGAVDDKITYQDSVALLGFTPDNLISEAIDAIIAHDGPALYGVIERVVIGGFDPRKFVEDLLAYVRDLLVLTIAGVHAQSALGTGQSAQVIEDMQRQASHLDLNALNVMAERINTALSSMSGTMSPRMRLELLAASLLLPISTMSVTDLSQSQHSGSMESAASQSGSKSAHPSPSRRSRATARVAAEKSIVSGETSAVENTVNAESAQAGATPNLVHSKDTSEQHIPLDPAHAADEWANLIQSLPEQIRHTVSAEHIPHVELRERGGRHFMVLTFADPLSQYAFGLAVSNEPVQGETKLLKILNAKLTHTYGEPVIVAPAAHTVDGHSVPPMSKLNASEQAQIKSQIAQMAAKAALASLKAGRVEPKGPISSHESHESSETSGSDDAEADHHAAQHIITTVGAPNATDIITEEDDFDPWARPVSSSHTEDDKQHELANGVLAVNSVEAKSEAESETNTEPDAENSNSAGISPDAAAREKPNDYDPWAVQASDHVYGERDGARQEEDRQPNVTHETDYKHDKSAHLSRGISHESSHRLSDTLTDRKSGESSDSSLAHTRVEETQEESEAKKESVSAEDDTYSIDDIDISAGQMSMEDVEKLFNAKRIEEFSANDAHNPVQ
ncbi:DNA polymerase III subunit gamma/tau [Alloscardovia venturai]|uniref:DNA-directed DNA polymerase n=1 Tax=Alloscardovia venturai TaxID=1769421 RepID=A0ABW2Y3L9_9BIFI